MEGGCYCGRILVQSTFPARILHHALMLEYKTFCRDVLIFASGGDKALDSLDESLRRVKEQPMSTLSDPDESRSPTNLNAVPCGRDFVAQLLKVDRVDRVSLVGAGMSIASNRQMQGRQRLFQFRPQLLDVIVVHVGFISVRFGIGIPCSHGRQSCSYSQLIHRRAQLSQMLKLDLYSRYQRIRRRVRRRAAPSASGTYRDQQLAVAIAIL